VAAIACLTGTPAEAQTAAGELVLTTGGATFRMPPLSSLVNETAVLGAAGTAERALTALVDTATAAATEIDRLDADLAVNAAAMEKEKETVAKERLALQPLVDAYTRDQEALRADDEQLVKDQAPVKALIDAYNRTPEKERTTDQYDRIAALKAPFDKRFEALKARKDALGTRFVAIEDALTAQERVLAGMTELDAALLARRKAKTAELGEAYRQLRAAHGYATDIRARLEKGQRTPPTLVPLLNRAADVLKTLSGRGFDGVKNPAGTEAGPR